MDNLQLNRKDIHTARVALAHRIMRLDEIIAKRKERGNDPTYWLDQREEAETLDNKLMDYLIDRTAEGY